jgi:transcriptional regulator with XRE-family HTH domain
MKIGTAIKTIRKQKGLSQKDLSKLSSISVNALSLIETNSTFPQKTTIESISKSLGVPVSYLLFLSISDEDIPIEKRQIFNTLNSAMKQMLLAENDKMLE